MNEDETQQEQQEQRYCSQTPLGVLCSAGGAGAGAGQAECYPMAEEAVDDLVATRRQQEEEHIEEKGLIEEAYVSDNLWVQHNGLSSCTDGYRRAPLPRPAPPRRTPPSDRFVRQADLDFLRITNESFRLSEQWPKTGDADMVRRLCGIPKIYFIK
ncbi:U1 small nuclear ribonucleoprotein component SNU71 [Frankliniella fusca]|uniref:U1 small nuclear ribonucleoprotein component SNU71 n=1 Tax=Frankliniella fusca TaxID=407009 RepID=A0AAE1GZR9_9NEOP|nr:U1 small nuclear ribonucleoprotein component SNU71 [Frankliniella fusca]